MTILAEPVHAGEFLVSEAKGNRSREELLVTSGSNLKAGQVVKIVSTKLVAHGGTGTAVGVLYADIDATDADTMGVYIARDAEIDSSLLIEHTVGVQTTFNGLGIYDRG